MIGRLLVLILVVGLILAASPVSAQYYIWRDATGNTHLTDDLNVIPERHRSEAKRVGGPPPPAAPTRKRPDDGPPRGPGLAQAETLAQAPGQRALGALKQLHLVSQSDVGYDLYWPAVERAEAAINREIDGVRSGPLREAILDGLTCHKLAAENWRGQLNRQAAGGLPVNMRPVRDGWACASLRIAEAERHSRQR